MLALVLLVGTVVARAQDPTAEDIAEAKRLFANGERLYAEGSYEQALVALQAAYDLSGEELLLFDMANACERLGQLERAVELLNAYRPFADPSEQDVLYARIRALEGRIAATAVPPPLTPHRRKLAPAVVTASGVALGLLGGTFAGVTWVHSRTILDEGDAAEWDRIRPLNNAAGAVGIAGGLVAVAGLSWTIAL